MSVHVGAVGDALAPETLVCGVPVLSHCLLRLFPLMGLLIVEIYIQPEEERVKSAIS